MMTPVAWGLAGILVIVAMLCIIILVALVVSAYEDDPLSDIARDEYEREEDRNSR